ncbi:helix-turn-helix domain-containing protein [Burkholderia glumae]|uniref:helix-turn-helix domain-containing protein n=1 Tax=Burkholderia glumae TaxID=337 RepID=UPI003B9B4F7E
MADNPTKSATADDIMTNQQAAKLLGVEPETLAQWRYLGKFAETLPYYKVGRRVMYRRGDLVAFLDTCRVGGANDEGAE